MDLSALGVMDGVLLALAGLLCGCAKTGVPGLGILVVPLMALVLGGKPSVGALLPLLIAADCFAVFWYRAHVEWDKVGRLVPWVLPGMAAGAWVLGTVDGWRVAGVSGRDLFEIGIGVLILVMLGLVLARLRYGERFTPRHPLVVGLTGAGTGLATTLANAAGPIMTLYLAGMRMPKERFMGTNAVFFLCTNLAKVPIYLAVGWLGSGAPLFTRDTLLLDACLLPLVVAGVFTGKWLFSKLPQKLFDRLVLALAALAALALCLAPLLGRD